MSITLLLTALAIALIIEGLIPALFPNKWRNYMTKLANEPVQNIRTIGLTICCLGIGILCLIV